MKFSLSAILLGISLGRCKINNAPSPVQTPPSAKDFDHEIITPIWKDTVIVQNDPQLFMF